MFLNVSLNSSCSIMGLTLLTQALHGEVEQQRSKFDDLLQSCDLYDTPFDHTQFESDVTALREQLAACDKVPIALHILHFQQSFCNVETYHYSTVMYMGMI